MNPDYQEKLKHCELRELLRLLGEVEARLGTPDELHGDLERAQAIAHQLNNLYTAELLLRELKLLPARKGGAGPPSGANPGAA